MTHIFLAQIIVLAMNHVQSWQSNNFLSRFQHVCDKREQVIDYYWGDDGLNVAHEDIPTEE